MIEQGILEHAAMRRTLTQLGIAEVWVVPAMDARFDFHLVRGSTSSASWTPWPRSPPCC